mgnify:FL=1
MSEYGSFVALALDLLGRKGQPITITTVTTGAYSPSTGGVSSTETVQTGVGVPVGYKASEIDGTNIKRGDVKVIVAASGLTEPKVNGQVSFIGFAGTIKNVEIVAPDGTPIVYKLQVRK